MAGASGETEALAAVASGEVVLAQHPNGCRTVHLNRPRALNALHLAAIEALDASLVESAHDDLVRCVVVTGEGSRAFCAGGDIKSLHRGSRDGDASVAETFFRAEYNHNLHIFRFAKPYVAVLDGITMGGGVGISVHGRYRVVTERTMFAMPETGIGLITDVGGSYFLSRLPRHTGMYLALTGARLRAADMAHVGLATHYVPSARVGALLHDLTHGLVNGVADVERALATHAQPFEQLGTPPLCAVEDVIARCFSANTVEEIAARLDREQTPWAAATLRMLQSKCPTSVKVTHEALLRGRTMDLDDCLRMEYRVAVRMVMTPNFRTGVNSAVIAKDGKPQWQPAALVDVSRADVEGYFEALESGEVAFTYV